MPSENAKEKLRCAAMNGLVGTLVISLTITMGPAALALPGNKVAQIKAGLGKRGNS